MLPGEIIRHLSFFFSELISFLRSLIISISLESVPLSVIVISSAFPLNPVAETTPVVINDVIVSSKLIDDIVFNPHIQQQEHLQAA